MPEIKSPPPPVIWEAQSINDIFGDHAKRSKSKVSQGSPYSHAQHIHETIAAQPSQQLEQPRVEFYGSSHSGKGHTLYDVGQTHPAPEEHFVDTAAHENALQIAIAAHPSLHEAIQTLHAVDSHIDADVGYSAGKLIETLQTQEGSTAFMDVVSHLTNGERDGVAKLERAALAQIGLDTVFDHVRETSPKGTIKAIKETAEQIVQTMQSDISVSEAQQGTERLVNNLQSSHTATENAELSAILAALVAAEAVSVKKLGLKNTIVINSLIALAGCSAGPGVLSQERTATARPLLTESAMDLTLTGNFSHLDVSSPTSAMQMMDTLKNFYETQRPTADFSTVTLSYIHIQNPNNGFGWEVAVSSPVATLSTTGEPIAFMTYRKTDGTIDIMTVIWTEQEQEPGGVVGSTLRTLVPEGDNIVKGNLVFGLSALPGGGTEVTLSNPDNPQAPPQLLTTEKQYAPVDLLQAIGIVPASAKAAGLESSPISAVPSADMLAATSTITATLEPSITPTATLEPTATPEALGGAQVAYLWESNQELTSLPQSVIDLISSDPTNVNKPIAPDFWSNYPTGLFYSDGATPFPWGKFFVEKFGNHMLVDIPVLFRGTLEIPRPGGEIILLFVFETPAAGGTNVIVSLMHDGPNMGSVEIDHLNNGIPSSWGGTWDSPVDSSTISPGFTFTGVGNGREIANLLKAYQGKTIIARFVTDEGTTTASCLENVVQGKLLGQNSQKIDVINPLGGVMLPK